MIHQKYVFLLLPISFFIFKSSINIYIYVFQFASIIKHIASSGNTNSSKEIDRDKTPLAIAPKSNNSTISRLESKYSDVLGRVARRRKEQQQDDDREKTLEPERPYMNPVTRSATTVLCEKAYQSYQKERTPYKLQKNHRSKYFDGDHHLTFKPRSELSLLQENNRYTNKKNNNNNNFSEYDPIRRKDTLYDAYTRQGNRYGGNNNNLNYRNDYASAKTRGCDIDYAHYYDTGKENSFKSKYDPDMLYAEINNNNTLSNGNGGGDMLSISENDRDRKRQMKSYKRTGSSTDRRHTTNFKELKDEPQMSTTTTNRYAHRKSSDHPTKEPYRSQTQKFFDTETLSSTNNLVAKIKDESTIPGHVLTEREARRKEIQSLIMKYAQLDDCYNKATEDLANNNVTQTQHTEIIPTTTNINNKQQQQQSQIAMSIAPINIGVGNGGIGSSGGFLSLSKTQSVSAMSSIRSRIPLTTFVRDF